MYKAVIRHAYDRDSEMALMKKAISSGGSSAGVTYSSNTTGNRAHDKATGKFTFNPYKAARIAGAVEKGSRGASNNLKNINLTKKGPRADLSKYDDKELQRILNRERMEREYDSYFNTPVETKGQKFVNGVDKALPYITVAAGLAVSGFTIWGIIKDKEKDKGKDKK